MDNNKYMFDAWFDDILNDVRDNVVGEYWNKYLTYKYYREILKDLLHHTKLVYKHKYPSRGPVAHFNYGNDYELESPSNTINHIEKYSVPENELNDLHNVYYFILQQIVKTQGEENILTESNDKQKEFLDKVVDRLLRETEYKIWDMSSHHLYQEEEFQSTLRKIRAEIKFGLVNTWREGESEYFDMLQVQNNSLRNEPRKYEYLEDYERDQLKNIYGLTDDEMVKVVYKYYTKLYNNIYKSYLEMDEDNKVPTSEPEKWFRGDEVFEIGGRLNESLSSRVNKDVDDLFSTNKKLSNEKKIKSIFMDKYGMNKQDADQAMVIYLSKQQSLNESDRQGRFLDRIIEQLVKETIIYPSEGMISLPNEPDDKYNARKIFDPKDYFYNRFLSNIIHHSRDFYGLSDEEIDYVWKNYFYEIKTNYYYLKELNESTEKPKGFNLKYLFKVADSIIKEIELDDYDIPGTKMRGYGPWNDNSTGHYGFWTGLEKHAKNIYGLTQAETEMVSGIVWDSLNSKNIYLSDYIHSDEKTRKGLESLREQYYPDWDERSREQNINLLKAKGIDILSTDSNVPFFKRIDSKEIRYLKNVVDRLDKESKIEVIGGDYAIEDEDFLLITPFGKFDFTDFMREYSNRRFEKYINDIYAVGDNQIMFPTHNSISQIGENYFLWGMYKDKLKRKYLKLVNPGLPDIPDEAIIIENDLTSDEHKSLLQSFEVMDTPEEIASEELGNMIKWVKTLPEELFLYRVLYLNEVNDINYEELGSHYSQDRTDLINNHYDRGSIYGDMGEHAYLITVKVPKSEVDVMETLNNNILYPHEKEITLKDKGRGAQYLDIEKI